MKRYPAFDGLTRVSVSLTGCSLFSNRTVDWIRRSASTSGGGYNGIRLGIGWVSDFVKQGAVCGRGLGKQPAGRMR
jgi:hypothetical protein